MNTKRIHPSIFFVSVFIRGIRGLSLFVFSAGEAEEADVVALWAAARELLDVAQ